MVYYFSFYDPHHDRIFYDQIKTHQCLFIKKNNERCKKNCVLPFEYCYSHLPIKLNLQIRKSTIPNAGKGLFAYKPYSNPNDIVFKKNQKICNYNGDHINLNELNARYGNYTAPYAVKISNNEFIDSALERGVGSFANTKNNHNNAEFTISYQHHTASLKAKRNIRNNEEIFLGYGRAYRMPNVEHVRYYTKPYSTKY